MNASSEINKPVPAPSTIGKTSAGSVLTNSRPNNDINTKKYQEEDNVYKPPTLTSAAASRRSNAKPGSVKERIQLFEGERPLLQRRLDQLTKKWELDANKTGVIKGKTKKIEPKAEWYSSPKSGTYKKRIVYE